MISSDIRPKIIYSDKQYVYIKVKDTVFKTEYKNFSKEALCDKSCKTEDNPKEDKSKQTEDVISVDVKDYVSVLDKMLQNGYFVGISDEISKNNIKNVRKNEFTGYGEITLVLKNEVIDIISKAISDEFTLANIVVADNKEFDRTLLEVKRKSPRSRSLLFEGEKNYIKNRWY